MRKALVAVAVSVVMLGWGINKAMAVCGDGTVDSGEDCDLGGSCVGGSAAGTACHVGDATCTGGTCTTFGGKGCAANCTTEHDILYTLVPGVLDGLNVAPGTSGVAIASDFLSIPLPLGPACNGGDNAGATCATQDDCPGGTCVPSQQILTVGKKSADGTIPVVVKASTVKFPGIPVGSGLACGCIHGISSKTCGGTFFEPDGHTLSTNCTPGFSTGDPCAGKAPCAFVHGDGNTAAGTIGCNGLSNTDISFEQDSGGSGGACAAPNSCPAIVSFSGSGGPGSAVIFQTLGITAALGNCVGSDPSVYGPDGVFCTDDDPSGGIIAVAGTLPVTTGTATAVVHNANGSDGTDLGPVTATGAPFSCTAIECGANSSAAGAGVVGAFSFVHLDTVGDVAVTAQLFAAGTPPDPSTCVEHIACTGDCDGSGEVTVDELITMVNIDLGTSPLSACPAGDADGSGDITINEIIQAVNFALTSCPAA